MSGLRLFRAHGLGNDYLVLDRGPALTAPLVRAICDRHHGVGGDGILEPRRTDRADHGVRIWNPDGSIAEKSGNGLRIFARFLVDRRAAPPSFSIDTGADVVQCEVGPQAIAIEMGKGTLDPASLPVLASAPIIDEPWEIGEATLAITAVATGNPHLVTFTDQPLETLAWRTYGPLLERHPRLPNRANVQFARVLSPQDLEIRIWERGAGPTLASGSSSCAAVTAAVVTGRIQPGKVAVHMPGGVLSVTISPELDLTLEGPVEVIGDVEVDESWLKKRAG